MANNNETTTKFKVDISELQKSMQEAKRQVAVVDSEFQAVSSTMDDWSKSSDGISAKLKQLSSNLASQKTILANYERQLELTTAEYPNGGKAVDDLIIKINKQKAVINKTEKELSGYESALQEVSEAEKLAAKTGKSVSEVLEDVGDGADDAGDGFTILKGAVADFVGDALTQLVDALREGITSLVSFSDEADNAMNSFQASTGAAVEDMAEFEQSMENIYKGNYGESFEDIADSMATVKSTLGDWLSAEGLEILTKDALILRDTFDFEVSESIRAAKSLMDQFGIDGEYAYNLIAQGAQKGLNQNGDLLDVINEYAVQFAGAGYEAEDMFNMLANGVSTGTWSVDKLGDAVKEMNIRFSDGTVATALEENRKALGLTQKEVKGLQTEYNEGGDSAQSAVNRMIEAIMSVEDETERYKLGVSVFGTMWEDLGANAISALMDTNGQMDMSIDTMKEIDAIKYDSVGSALQGIGRNIQTGILMPIGDKLLPIISELAEKFRAWLDDPATQEGIKAFTDSVVEFVDNGLTAIKDGVTWFLSNKDFIIAGISGIATALGAIALFNFNTLLTGFTKWASTTKLVTAAQSALNLVMNMNPIGIIITLIAALVAAFIYLWNNSEEFRQFWINLWENIKEFCSKAIDSIVNFFTVTIPEAIANMVSFLSQLPQKFGTWLLATINKVIQWRQDMIAKAKEAALGFLNKTIEFFKELPIKILTWLTNVITKIVQWRQDMIAKAKEAALGFINKTIEYIKQLPSKVLTWLTDTISKVTSWAGDLAAKGREAGENLLNSIVEKVKEIPENMLSIGSDIVRGLWNGIDDMSSWIAGKLQSFGDGVLSGIKDFFGIASPSKVMATEVGRWLPEGIAVGIDKNAKSAISAMRDMAVNTVGAARDGLSSANATLGVNGVATGGVINNFTQNNYSPKALGRLDIYRQSKNLLGFAGGGV